MIFEEQDVYSLLGGTRFGPCSFRVGYLKINGERVLSKFYLNSKNKADYTYKLNPMIKPKTQYPDILLPVSSIPTLRNVEKIIYQSRK